MENLMDKDTETSFQIHMVKNVMKSLLLKKLKENQCNQGAKINY